MEAKELLVIKVGTSTLTNELDRLSEERFNLIAKQIVELKHTYDIAIVSSAAISGGAARLGVNRQDHVSDLDYLSMLASVGQPVMMEYWQQALSPNHIVSQHIITPRELQTDIKERTSFLRKLSRAIQAGLIPVINENDAIADDEIKVGDNDTISALIVLGLGEQGLWSQIRLVNLTDVDGYYDGDPNDPDSKVISKIANIEAVKKYAAGTSGHHGTGGGKTKLEAATMVTSAGYEMYLINGKTTSGIQRALRGEIGTHFVAKNRVE